MKPHFLRLVVIAALAVSSGANAAAQAPVVSSAVQSHTSVKGVAPVKPNSGINTPVKNVTSKTGAEAGIEAAPAHRVIADHGQLGQMQQMHNARDRLTQTNTAQNDPATGTRLAGHGFQANNRVGIPDFSQYSNASPSRDCITDPAQCLRNNTSRGQGRFAAPPAAGSAVPDQRGKASSGFTAQASSINNNGSGYVKAVYVDQRGNTTNFTREYTPNAQGGGTVLTRISTTDNGGNVTGTTTIRQTFDENGNRVENGYQRSGKPMTQETAVAIGHYVQNAEEEAAERIDTEHENDQPGVTDASVSNPDNCGWHPIVGCTKKSAKPDRSITASPVRGEQGDTANNSGSSKPHLDLSAVVNSGDGGWSVSSNYNSNHGRPLDMRDPPKGDGTGPVPVPHGGFAP